MTHVKAEYGSGDIVVYVCQTCTNETHHIAPWDSMHEQLAQAEQAQQRAEREARNAEATCDDYRVKYDQEEAFSHQMLMERNEARQQLAASAAEVAGLRAVLAECQELMLRLVPRVFAGGQTVGRYPDGDERAIKANSAVHKLMEEMIEKNKRYTEALAGATPDMVGLLRQAVGLLRGSLDDCDQCDAPAEWYCRSAYGDEGYGTDFACSLHKAEMHEPEDAEEYQRDEIAFLDLPAVQPEKE